jgi:hypothetical protein
MRELAMGEIERSDIIFEGQMGPGELKEGTLDLSGSLQTPKKGHHDEMEFEALRVYRGPSKRSFILLYNEIDTSCAVDFNSGDKYLIFANAIPGSNKYITHAGKINSLIEKAGPALRALRGEPPQPEDLLDPKAYDDRIHAQFGSVCGKVVGPDAEPLPDAGVTLWSVDDNGTPPKYQFVHADSDGSFCIKDVAEGKFWLGALKYERGSHSRLVGYYPKGFDRSEALSVEVLGRAAVSGLKLTLQRQGSYPVTFRIVPAERKFHSKPAAIVVKSKNGDALYYHDESCVVDAEGVARPLMSLAPGRYIVSIFFGMRSTSAAAIGLLAQEAKLPLPEQEVDIVRSGEIVVKVMPPD